MRSQSGNSSSIDNITSNSGGGGGGGNIKKDNYGDDDNDSRRSTNQPSAAIRRRASTSGIIQLFPFFLFGMDLLHVNRTYVQRDRRAMPCVCEDSRSEK